MQFKIVIPSVMFQYNSIWTEEYVPKIQFLSSKYITLTVVCENASYDINVWSCRFIKMLYAIPWYSNICAGCLHMMFKS